MMGGGGGGGGENTESWRTRDTGVQSHGGLEILVYRVMED